MVTAVIKLSDMPKNMEEKAIATAKQAIQKCNTPDQIAGFIKKAFETEFGQIWHCFAGRNFSSFVTHEKGKYIYFYLGHTGVCLFSSG